MRVTWNSQYCLIGLQFQFAALLITLTVFVRGYSFNPTSITIFSCFSSRFDENFTAGLWPTSDLEENLTLEMGVTQERPGAWSPAITAQSALGGEPTHIATWPCWDMGVNNWKWHHFCTVRAWTFINKPQKAHATLPSLCCKVTCNDRFHLVIDDDTPIALLPVLGVPLPGDEHSLGPGLHHLQHPTYEPVTSPGPHQHPLPPVHQLPCHPALLRILTEQNTPPEILSGGWCLWRSGVIRRRLPRLHLGAWYCYSLVTWCHFTFCTYMAYNLNWKRKMIKNDCECLAGQN